jgi:hypothetical protein
MAKRLEEMTDAELEDEARELEAPGKTAAAEQHRAYVRFRPRLSAFDGFVGTSTWHTRHPFDKQRFHLALHKVVWSDEFNADQMADYLRIKVTLPPENQDHQFAKQINRYRDDASAVKEFIKHNRVPKD